MSEDQSQLVRAKSGFIQPALEPRPSTRAPRENLCLRPAPGGQRNFPSLNSLRLFRWQIGEPAGILNAG